MDQTGASSRELDHGLGGQLVTLVRMDEVSDSHEHLASIYRTREQQLEAMADRGRSCRRPI